MDYLQRFSLRHDVFPRDAKGKTFFSSPGIERLAQRFTRLARDPGIGLLTGDVGVGKTAAIRHLCHGLPRPDFQIVYLAMTATSPIGLYRQLASGLGLEPPGRKVQLWKALEEAMLHMVDEQGIQPVLVIDEAQHLPEEFLLELGALVTTGMDARCLATVWLLGPPVLRARLRMKSLAALDSRIAARVHLEPLTEREVFFDFLHHGFQAAGATSNLLADSAGELLFRASRGVPRRAAHLLREALMTAHEQDKNFIDDAVLESVLDQESLQ